MILRISGGYLKNVNISAQFCCKECMIKGLSRILCLSLSDKKSSIIKRTETQMTKISKREPVGLCIIQFAIS